MRIIAAILLVLGARCAHLHIVVAADTVVTRSGDLVKGFVKNIGDGISDVVHDVIPDCFFGVESISIVLFTR